MPVRPALAVVALALLFAPGCGPAKLNQTKVLKLDKQTMAAALDLEPQKVAQKITVEFSSSDGDVFIGVFKKADAPNDDDLTMTPASKALVSKKSKGDTFTVDVPENTAVRVVVREHSTAKTDVTVKVTNAK